MTTPQPAFPATGRTREIVRLHKGIAAKLQKTVLDAIRIGELLQDQKKALNHGEFLPYIRECTPHLLSG